MDSEIQTTLRVAAMALARRSICATSIPGRNTSASKTCWTRSFVASDPAHHRLMMILSSYGCSDARLNFIHSRVLVSGQRARPQQRLCAPHLARRTLPRAIQSISTP